jgi:hypothetical protein
MPEIIYPSDSTAIHGVESGTILRHLERGGAAVIETDFALDAPGRRKAALATDEEPRD